MTTTEPLLWYSFNTWTEAMGNVVPNQGCTKDADGTFVGSITVTSDCYHYLILQDNGDYLNTAPFYVPLNWTFCFNFKTTLPMYSSPYLFMLYDLVTMNPIFTLNFNEYYIVYDNTLTLKSNIIAATLPSKIFDDRWHHFAIMLDQGTLRFRIDGQDMDSFVEVFNCSNPVNVQFINCVNPLFITDFRYYGYVCVYLYLYIYPRIEFEPYIEPM